MAEIVRVARLEQLGDGEPLCIEHEGVPYCLIKVEENIHAYVAICSHKDQAMFPPKMKRGLLVCPHHKVAFDPATGEVVEDRGKSVKNLVPVRTEIIDGMVHLESRKRYRKLVSKGERRWLEKVYRQFWKKRKANCENDDDR